MSTADAAAVIVWMAPDPPDAREKSTLAAWASRRGIALVAPGEGGPTTLEVDPAVAGDVESLLGRARDALTAGEGAVVDEALDAAESRLRAHPELPQAAWLMAEVERIRSTRRHRIAPIDAAGARRAWARAAALDGGRLAGLGELGGADAVSPSAVVTLTLADGQRALVDGRAISSSGAAAPAADANAAADGMTLFTGAGLHDLVVTWGGAPVWAEWVEIAPGSSSLAVNAPTAPPCSLADVGRAHFDATGMPTGPVRCAAWVAATSGPDAGSVRVALCRSSRCEPLASWGEASGEKAPAWTIEPSAAKTRASGWPSWATWGLVGAGAAVALGVSIAVAQGLSSSPAETRFVSGGLKMP